MSLVLMLLLLMLAERWSAIVPLWSALWPALRLVPTVALWLLGVVGYTCREWLVVALAVAAGADAGANTGGDADADDKGAGGCWVVLALVVLVLAVVRLGCRGDVEGSVRSLLLLWMLLLLCLVLLLLSLACSRLRRCIS